MSGTAFRNPVIPGYHPDPSVVRVGDTYWCVTSSFTHFPGVPLFRSTDLVGWEQVGNVLDRPSQFDLSGSEWSSAGIYAPTIRHHDGLFYMITTVVGSNGLKLFFVTTDDPLKGWSDPVLVDIVGIDPDIAWDDDGNCWVYHSIMEVKRARIDHRTGAVLSPPEPTWNGTGLHAPEAPHLYQIDGTWYLMIAEGGTERGHAVSIARGPSPEGPWETCPHNPILSHRSTSRPIQNTGHGDLVQAPDGSWWMLLLGVRATGVTPHFHVMGRETFLTPVQWHDGWPVVSPAEVESPVRPPGAALPPGGQGAGAGDVRDDFDRAALAPQWVALRRSAAEFASLSARPGSLVLTGGDPALGPTMETVFPVYVGRRQQHQRFTVRAAVDADTSAAGSDAGLAVAHDEAAHCRVALEGDRIVARVRLAGHTITLGDAPRPAGAVVLVVRNDTDDPTRPDTIRLGYEGADGGFVQVGEFDGRYLSTEVQGGFIGRTIGMFATGCTAAFDWFHYEGEDA